MTLRSSVIRLAHANPALRHHLLPILKEAAPDPRQNLINALIGELKRDSGGHIKKDLIERAEKYAEGHFDCDDLMDRSDRELINPSIDMDRVLAGDWENWLLKIARANPKVGAIVKSYLALRDSQGVRGDDALSELIDGPVEVYLIRIHGDSVEGGDLEDIYDAMRENCAEADEEASDPYGSRGLRQRDFYASNRTPRTMTTLRSSLIRLAHSNPKLRPDLLLLLKTAAKVPKAAPKLKGKKLDDAISKAYYRHGEGVQVNIMDIGKIYDAGKKAYEAADTVEAADAALDEAMVAAIAKFRV